ncbi:MAG: putative L-lactate dehydrogenase operon regulatory protein [Firmicutes bacterium ADurb.Bin080]|nr:FadR family transcriptional regulator [Clostridiales bacterium]OQC12192.1 MAG: putative L-lactate dehydrogenase operon regulatory protein [Firmicutes bacterium ADurb.Bin080]
MSKSLTDKLVAEIEQKIVKGEWGVGEKIPTHREMVSLFSVSRSVINAAIKDLDSMGYLEIIPRKRIVVADWKNQGTLSVLGALIREKAFDKKTLSSLLRSRELIETECAKLAALNSTPKNIEEIKNHISLGKNILTISEKVEYDIKFHHLIAVASGNIVYALIIKSFEDYSREFISPFYKSGDVFPFVSTRHEKLLSAIKDRDPESASNIMKEILSHGEKIILSLLDKL